MDAVKTRLPDLNTVEAHPGRFTREEIKSVSLKAPGVLVAIPAVRSVQPAGDGLVECEVRTVAVAVAKDAFEDGVRVERADAVLAIIGSLLVLLPSAALGAGTGACRDIKADNLYGREDGQQGLAMWAVHWTNTLQLTADEFEVWGPADVRGSLAPDTGPDHIEDYRPLSEGVLP